MTSLSMQSSLSLVALGFSLRKGPEHYFFFFSGRCSISRLGPARLAVEARGRAPGRASPGSEVSCASLAADTRRAELLPRGVPSSPDARPGPRSCSSVVAVPKLWVMEALGGLGVAEHLQ